MGVSGVVDLGSEGEAEDGGEQGEGGSHSGASWVGESVAVQLVANLLRDPGIPGDVDEVVPLVSVRLP